MATFKTPSGVEVDDATGQIVSGTPSAIAPTAPPPTPAASIPPSAPAQPDINSMIGTRPSQVDPSVTEYFNAQSGVGFKDPGELSGFINSQLGSQASTPQNVFENLKQGFGKTANLPVPQSQGEASSAISTLTPNTPKPFQLTPLSQIDTLLAEDKGYQQLLADRTDYNNTANQGKSLLDFYNQAVKEAGIPGLNEQLLNYKNIIDGTEEDIRKEVQAVSGFATESQVLGLASARNKSLIKNYNNLVDQKKMAMESITNMTNLAGQDREFALQSINQKFNFDKEIASYRDKFVNNAKEGLGHIIEAVGYGGLYASLQNDPSSLSLVEKTLGLGAGQLQQLAIYKKPLTETEQADLDLKKSQIATSKFNLTQSQAEAPLDIAAKKADIALKQSQVANAPLDAQLKKAQIANIYSEIGKRNKEGQIVVDQNGKVIPKQEEAMKINKELVGSDAYKAITKAKDSLQYLTAFEDTFNKTGSTSAIFSPRQNADLKTKYNTAILNLKEFFNLGVLNGPDEAILRGVLPDPTSRSATLGALSFGIYKPSAATKSGIENMKKMIETSLDDRYKSLSSQYGDYSSSSVNGISDLNRVYVDQKSKLNPQIQQMLKDNPSLDYEDVISIITQ